MSESHLTPIEPEENAGCSFPGCDRELHAKGYCFCHYRQNLAGQELKPIRKRCPQGQSPLYAMKKDRAVRLPKPACTFAGCDKPQHAGKLCVTHYQQLTYEKELHGRRHYSPPGDRHLIACAEEACPNPYLNGPCLIFIGTKFEDGYGQIRRHDKLVCAHRLAYEQDVGPIPEGLVLDHWCRNRACCNPDHMRVVTRTINASDNRVESERYHATNADCRLGHQFTDENTFIMPDGCRQCIACILIHVEEVKLRPTPAEYAASE